MPGRTLPILQRTEIDGIPAVWAETAGGPFVAALGFRVGRADEPLPQAGISHIVEHLALARLGVQEYEHNGFVDATRTVFHSMGTTDEAIEFMSAVTQGLVDPPLARLQTERRILRSEADQQGPSIGGAIRQFRFGYTGHGLIGEDELGLGWLGPTAVSGWIADRFNRANAALWLSGPPPAGLRVELPDGARHAPPPVTPIGYVRFPSHNVWNGPGATLTWLVRRDPAANMLVNIAHRRARQRLRFDQGLIYDVAMDYEPLDGQTAHVTLGADAPEDQLDVVRDALLAVLDELATDGPTQDELDIEVNGFERQFEDRDATLGFLDACVLDILFGEEPRTAEAILEGRRAVTPASAAETLRASLATLLVVAGGTPLPSERATPYPAWSLDRVDGREHGPAGFFLPGRKPKERLFVGPAGVTLQASPDQWVTVRYADCVAVAHESEVRRELFGRDGFRVRFDATLWKDGPAILAAIDAAIPQALVACDEHGIDPLPDGPVGAPGGASSSASSDA